MDPIKNMGQQPVVGESRQIRTLMAFSLLCFACGCAGLGEYNPATGRNEVVFLSTQEEVALGKQSHTEFMQEMKLSKDPLLLEQINRIGPKIAAVSDRQDYTYQFYIVEGDDLNAFTTPGGNIYVYTGLVHAMQTDDRIAGVVAHEIGHCAAKHVAKKFQKALGYNIIYAIALSASGDNRQLVELGAGTLMSLAMSAYSRKDEYEADILGVKYTTLAGFDPKGLIESFEILKAKEKGPKVPTLLSTHPHTDDRINALKEEVALAPYKYRR